MSTFRRVYRLELSVVGSLSLLLLMSACAQSYDLSKHSHQSPQGTQGPTKTDGTVDDTEGELVTDTFHVTVNHSQKKVDVLFVLDNSGSMTQEIGQVRDSFSKFIRGFAESNVDYHIGLISTDARKKTDSVWSDPNGVFRDFRNDGPGTLLQYTGNSTSKFQSSATMSDSQVVNEFTNNVNNWDINGSGNEMGLMSTIQFTGRLNDWNSGFVRNDALFSVIIVSDEDESRWADTSPAGFEPYVRDFPSEASARKTQFKNALLGLKPGRPDLIRYDAIGVPSYDECPTVEREQGQFPSTGYDFSEYFANTGSSFYDQYGVSYVYRDMKDLLIASQANAYFRNVCRDFSGELGDLSSDIATQVDRRFPLSHRAKGCMSVKLDGILIAESDTNGWTYMPDVNAVQLNGLNLESKSSFTVEVSYVPYLEGTTGATSSDLRGLASTSRALQAGYHRMSCH
jgi:hypothetical protein